MKQKIILLEPRVRRYFICLKCWPSGNADRRSYGNCRARVEPPSQEWPTYICAKHLAEWPDQQQLAVLLLSEL